MPGSMAQSLAPWAPLEPKHFLPIPSGGLFHGQGLGRLWGARMRGSLPSKGSWFRRWDQMQTS